MIEAGAAGVHFEDQLSSAKKCVHMGGKVLVPTQDAVQKLVAARLAADVCGVPTVLIARTDANGANLLTSDVDDRDKPFCTGRRTVEGFREVRAGLDQAIARGLAYAPYCDMIWCETAHPDMDEARRFAEAMHEQFPGKLLAYSRLQEREFDLERDHGYRAVKHQSFVGAGYFDDVTQVVMGGHASTTAMKGSTEEEQFDEKTPDFTEAETHHTGAQPLKKVPPPPELVAKP
jgi:isocitrate lyase